MFCQPQKAPNLGSKKWGDAWQIACNGRKHYRNQPRCRCRSRSQPLVRRPLQNVQLGLSAATELSACKCLLSLRSDRAWIRLTVVIRPHSSASWRQLSWRQLPRSRIGTGRGIYPLTEVRDTSFLPRCLFSLWTQFPSWTHGCPPRSRTNRPSDLWGRTNLSSEIYLSSGWGPGPR